MRTGDSKSLPCKAEGAFAKLRGVKSHGSNAQSVLWISIFLVIITFAVFAPVRQNGFVNYDDPIYLTDNPAVQAGINAQTIGWAFTTGYANFWHPLTWLSHMVDVALFGLNPAGHHLMAVLWHLANAVLVFLVLQSMTGALWRSACVAALFALHPLHVESVAWASERKDLLSAFFGLLTLWAYAKFTNRDLRLTSGSAEGASIVSRKSKIYYVLALVFFALGLMSKPMLVTLPFVMLLLDVWPLGRVTGSVWRVTRKATEASGLVTRHSSPDTHIAGLDTRYASRVILEKLPFFVLAAVTACLAFWTQKQGGAITSLSTVPLWDRVGNAAVSYFRYLSKTIVPTGLSVFYPQEHWALWIVAAAIVGLIAITILAIRLRNTRPYLFVGWFWFVGILLPVSGLVQIGIFSMADRYSYLPLIGMFIALVWAVDDVTVCWSKRGNFIGVGAIAALGACAVATTQQIRYWADTETLFAHAASVTKNNFLAEYNLAKYLAETGRTDQAVEHYLRVLDINPASFETHNNLSGLYIAQGKFDPALQHLGIALQLQPENAELHYNFALAASYQGRLAEAVEHYKQCVRISPDYVPALHNLAWILATSTRDELRNGKDALQFAKHACDLTKFKEVRCLDALDAAYAEIGDFSTATLLAGKASEMAEAVGDKKLAEAAEKRLKAYYSKQAYRTE